MRTGHGVFTYENGDRHEGTFIDNKMVGIATFTFADGTVKKGEWMDGRRTRWL